MALFNVALEKAQRLPTEATVQVRRDAAEWVARSRAMREDVTTFTADMINNAIVAAAWRQIGREIGGQVLSTTAQQVRSGNIAEPHELRPIRPWAGALPDDAAFIRGILPENWQLVQLLKREHYVSLDAAVDDGLRIMGRMALLGDDTLMIEDGEMIRAQSLPTLLPEDPPLPPFPGAKA